MNPKTNYECDKIEDLTVLMPVYNFENQIEKSVESVLNQKTKFRIFLYCFDDASEDKSSELLGRLEEKYSDRMKVFENSNNLGSGKASFLAHKPRLRSKYWCILEGDDHWSNDQKVEKQLTVLEQDERMVCCCAHTLLKDATTGTSRIIQPDRNNWNILDLLLRSGTHNFYVHTSSIIWRNIHNRTSSFFPKKFLPAGINGDPRLMRLMLSRGGYAENIPETMSVYNYSGKGRWSGLTDKEREEANNTLTEDLIHLTPKRYRLTGWLRQNEMLKYWLPRPLNE